MVCLSESHRGLNVRDVICARRSKFQILVGVSRSVNTIGSHVKVRPT